MYDLIIQNGNLIDGTGSDPFRCDIGIQNGKIVKIAQGLTDGREIIDATGLAVTPGFIDSHSHSDKAFLKSPDQVEKVEQGITTSIAGQCGNSQGPSADPETGVLRTMGDFLRDACAVPQGSNGMTFVGHKTLRLAVVGNENRPASEAEMAQMKALLAEGIDSGALGISFGLAYAPSCFADTEELVELARVAHEHGGMIAAHLRNESDHVVEAAAEFIEVLRRSGAKGIYSHHKSTQPKNWGKVKQTLAMVDAAAAEGIEIYSDAYPYTASSTSLVACFVPKEYRSGGADAITQALSDPEIRKKLRQINATLWGEDLSWVLVTKCSGRPEYAGKTLPEIAALRGQDVYDAVFDIIAQCRPTANACYFSMCEEDVRRVLAHPRTMVCTDSAVAMGSKLYHPRLRGSFPRVLGRYVRQDRIVPLPEMIRKMTSLPAQVYGIPEKGLLKEGYDADICIFDPDRILDHADFTHCDRPCEGLHYVLVNGQIAARDGVYTGLRQGKVLLRK